MNIDVENMLPILDIEELDQEMQDKIKPEEQTIEPETSNPPVEEKEEPINENDPPQESEKETGDNQLSTAFFNELAERGIALTQEGKEEYSWDDVDNVLKHYSEDLPMRVANSIINASPEYGKNLVNYILSKQGDLSKDDLVNYFQEHLEIVSLPDKFEDNETARNFLKEHYKNQFSRESQVNAMLDALEDDEALLEEANKVKTQRAQAQINKADQERTRRSNEQKQFVQSLGQEFDALSWDQGRVTKVKEFIISDRGNDLLSKIVNSPNGLIHLYDFMTYFDEQSGKFNLDNFIQASATKEAKRLKDKITNDMFTSATDSTKQVDKDEKKSFNLEDFEPIF